MQIKKFKLINDGRDGIEVRYAEAIKFKNAATIDDIKRTRNVPVSASLRTKIKGLTYFFLNLTRHWVLPFNKYFDMDSYDLIPVVQDKEMSGGEESLRNLWNDTTITGAAINNGDIIITGKINVFGDKTMGLATATVNEEDDFGFYNELKERLDEIADEIIEMMNTKEVVLDAATMRFALQEAVDKDISEDALAERVLDKFANKGMIIMQVDNALGEGEEDKMRENKNPVDAKNLPDAEEHKEETVQEDQQVGASANTSIDKGTLVAETEPFPDLDGDDPTPRGSALPRVGEDGDLSVYEYSDSMGSESEPEPEEEPWKDE